MKVGYSADPQGWHCQQRDVPMRIEDGFRKCVVFVGYVFEKNFVPAGTAFVVSAHTEGFRFDHVVTARHNIEAIERELSELQVPAEDAQIALRVNKVGGGVDYVYSRPDEWHFHPDATSYVDVAVMPTQDLEPSVPGEQLDVTTIYDSGWADEKSIALFDIMCGAPTITIGLFTSHFGEAHNVPIVRCGSIALMHDPRNMIKTRRGYMDAYLVEMHSLGGLSGSPVLVPAEPTWIAGGEVKRITPDHRKFCLLGLVHGRYHLEDPNDVVLDGSNSDEREANESYDQLNAGIAVVVPIDKVAEVINQEKLVKKRQQITEESRKRSGVREDSKPSRKRSVAISTATLLSEKV